MITKEQRMKMFEMRIDGKTYAEIAEAFNVYPSTVIRAISDKVTATPKYARNAVHPNLANWLVTNGFSLRRFAELAGVCAETVRKWLLGKNEPTLSNIRSVLEITGMSFEEAFARNVDVQEAEE